MSKIVCISDTHGHEIELPEGDILLHAGDFCMRGTLQEITPQLDWLEKNKNKFSHIVITMGNHDWIAQKQPQLIKDMCKERNIIYLENETVTVDGFKIFGSPIQPEFCNWAFNKQRGPQIKQYWDLIPDDTDIIVTHGPCHMLLDNVFGRRVGCEDLLNKVLKVKPKLHVCGHIHCNRGETSFQDIKFVNASIVNEAYQAVYDPIVVNV